MGSPLSTVLGQLRRQAGRERFGALTDAELLRRYAGRHDEAAFEVLVWRHGAMVLSVCRRRLGHAQDAEDGFQATFLALARAAGTVSRRESVGGWLYRVACRVANRARLRAARRATQELPEVPAPWGDPVHEAVWRNLGPVLDEEIARLPGKYRVPFVLCYLEGRSNAEAASELGCPRGTVATRLSWARQLLRARLTRRGVVLPGGLLAVALAQRAVAAPAPLVLTTVRAALAFAAGGADLDGLVSPAVADLTKGALPTMVFTRSRIVAAVLLAAGLFATWATAAHYFPAARPAAAPQAGTKQAAAAPPQARTQPGSGRLLFYRAGHLTLISPDGKDEKRVSHNRAEFHPGESWLSPDGKQVAFLIQIEQGAVVGRDPRRKVYVRALDGPEPGTDLGVEAQWLSWSPDGAQLVAADPVHGDDPKALKFVNWLVDVKTREKTALKLSDRQMVTDWSRDGKHFLTTELDQSRKEFVARLHLVSRDGARDLTLSDGKGPALMGRLSPDGRKVLYLGLDPERKGREKDASFGLFVLDIQKRQAVRVKEQPLNGTIMGFCWSPDSKRIAYGWRRDQERGNANQPTESYLVVADADGGNQVTIASEKGDSPLHITIGAADWR
jgi:RNA polymerase sigma factor (sigma-70 family)